MASSVTTIPIEKSVLKELKAVKQYPRQTYSELLLEMSKVFKANKEEEKQQYAEFLQKLQVEKKVRASVGTENYIASEKSLGKLWNLKEEDEAWKDL
jgi:predicted CopG family antitoxin